MKFLITNNPLADTKPECLFVHSVGGILAYDVAGTGKTTRTSGGVKFVSNRSTTAMAALS